MLPGGPRRGNAAGARLYHVITPHERRGGEHAVASDPGALLAALSERR